MGLPAGPKNGATTSVVTQKAAQKAAPGTEPEIQRFACKSDAAVAQILATETDTPVPRTTTRVRYVEAGVVDDLKA